MCYYGVHGEIMVNLKLVALVLVTSLPTSLALFGMIVRFNSGTIYFSRTPFSRWLLILTGLSMFLLALVYTYYPGGRGFGGLAIRTALITISGSELCVRAFDKFGKDFGS